MCPIESPDQPFRQRYVDRLNSHGALLSPQVERALRNVELHRLIDEFYVRVSPGQYQQIIHDPVSPLPEALDSIYSGDPITTNLEAGFPCQTPSVDSVAVMLEGLELELGMKLHTIGTRTGYEAALLAEIVGDQQLVSATGVDRDTETRIRTLLERSGYGDIDIRPLDGFYGNPERAPFDRILVLVGCPDISPHWVSQLEPQGFLLVPMGHGGWFPLLRDL